MKAPEACGRPARAADAAEPGQSGAALTTPLILEPVGRKGGMHYYNTGLCRGLVEAGLRPILCSSRDPLVGVHPGVQIEHVVEGVLDPASRLTKGLRLMRAAGQVAKICRAQKVQVVHCHLFGFTPHMYAALLRVRQSRVPIVATVHDVSDLGASRPMGWASRRILGLLSGVIVHNEYTARRLEEAVAGLRVPIATIPHGNYTEFYPALESEGVEDTVLFFGQVKPTKGLDVLLDAFGVVASRNPKARLIVAGKPWRESATRLEERVRELGLTERVELHLRYVGDEEVPDFFRRAGLVVLPYKEIFQSGVLLMCMSMGKATLTSDLPPFVETLDSSGGGRTFTTGCSASLAEELVSLLGNMSRLNELGAAALQHVRRHNDWSTIGLQTAEFYARVR